MIYEEYANTFKWINAKTYDWGSMDALDIWDGFIKGPDHEPEYFNACPKKRRHS